LASWRKWGGRDRATGWRAGDTEREERAVGSGDD